MCPFSTKNYAKMSIFLVKIRSGWGLCPQTPGCGPSLPNPGCVTGQAYEVLPSEILGWRRRRRRLAGHLFQDRWEDQGRGFILLPPWPPNCLVQMLTVRDFSQHLVSSSKTIRPNIPRGARCMGHCEMM